MSSTAADKADAGSRGFPRHRRHGRVAALAKVTPTLLRLLALEQGQMRIELEVRELRVRVEELTTEVRALTLVVRELLGSVKDVAEAVRNHEGRLRVLEGRADA